MPSMSKPLIAGLLALFCCCNGQMETLSWAVSGEFQVADLYFCCLPKDQYGYRKTLTGPCIPGAGPTIRLVPGNKYNVTVHNLCSRPVDPVTNLSLDSTNLHFHSLHVSPMGNMDNVLRHLNPGQCMLQNYYIPVDHSPGTHWYHPHVHTTTHRQVEGGAYGFVLIDGYQQAVNGHDANVKNFLTNRNIERQLLCNDMGMGNGNPKGAQISLVQNQWHYLRILQVSPNGVGTRPSSFLAIARQQCQVYELAADGVHYSRVPYQKFGSPVYAFTTHAAGRIDLAVKCSTVGSFAAYQYNGKVVAYFKVVAGKAGTETPFNNGTLQWAPVRPNYLVDLRDGKYPAEVTSVGPTFTVELGHGQTINRLKFDINVPLATFPYGPQYIQQFKIINSDQHPYHMHIQHFQVVKPGGCGLAMREGEFYDTISDTSDLDCVVRFRNIDFSGVIINHCHNLEHEDIGMMGWFNVLPGPGCFEVSPAFLPETAPVVCAGDAGFRETTEALSSEPAPSGDCPTTPVYPFVIMGVSLGVAALTVIVAVLMVRRNNADRMAIFDEMHAAKSHTPIFHTPNNQVQSQQC